MLLIFTILASQIAHFVLTQTVQKKRQMQYYASMNLVSGELVADYML